MREFTCKSMGNDCGWKQISATEELLTDVVAVHLRDCHDMKALTPEQVGKIKNLFSNPSPVDAKAAEGLVLKEFKCDLGPKCTWHYIAQTEELMVDGVAVHAREAHGITEFTPEMKARVGHALHPWQA